MELCFGMLMPMVLSQQSGLILLPDFTFATGLNYLLICLLSVGGLGISTIKSKVLRFGSGVLLPYFYPYRILFCMDILSLKNKVVKSQLTNVRGF